MSRVDRREFLRKTALLGASLGLQPLAASGAIPELPPRVRGRRTLGRTGLEISDIGFGSSSLSGDEALVRHALERGITYFDTAESYTGGDAEETLGRALEGHRDEVVLASKTTASAGATRAEIMAALEGSLRRLRTDRIDVYFNHAVNDVRRLQNPEWAEFATRARRRPARSASRACRVTAGVWSSVSTTPSTTTSPTWCWSDTTSARIRTSCSASPRAWTSSRCRRICPACCARPARRAWAWWR